MKETKTIIHINKKPNIFGKQIIAQKEPRNAFKRKTQNVKINSTFKKVKQNIPKKGY